MNRKKISSTVLKHLYFNQGLSMKAASVKLGISEPTLRKRFREHGLAVRPRGSWAVKYQKKPFNENEQDKAYIMGFRIGDMNVYKPKGNSKIIVVRTNSTLKEQVTLVQRLFGSYGGVRVSGKTSSKNVNCFLDESFSFLLVNKPYIVEEWIKRKPQNCLAFIAGYIDAEGNFTLNQGRARFKVDSYDKDVLFFMHKFLQDVGIRSKLRLIGKRNELRYGGGRWNDNLWRLNVNEATSLFKFLYLLNPYLLHEKRVSDAKTCFDNIIIRKQNCSV